MEKYGDREREKGYNSFVKSKLAEITNNRKDVLMILIRGIKGESYARRIEK